MDINQFNIEQKTEMYNILKGRFEGNMARHQGVEWSMVELKLEQSPEKLFAVYKMEQTGGEPDVIAFNSNIDELAFVDCSVESPIGRRSICFDEAALAACKKNKPETSAEAMAKEIGIEMLTEVEYRQLQLLGAFDLKTSSWVQTPDNIRQLGGALFCDRRYDTVFLYHNGADSYYSARGFRGKLML